MLTARQMSLVQASFEQVIPVRLAVADLFYDRLFTLDPSLRSLFSDDMVEQRRRLMDTISTAVQSLDHLERVVPAVQALGTQHITYGVLTEHYSAVGSAFVWTLERCLGAALTPEVRQAWADTYGLLAATMQHASNEVAV